MTKDQMHGPHNLIILVEGAWTTWDNWGACSGTCNTNTRTRSMLYSGNMPCSGTSSETGACQGQYEEDSTNRSESFLIKGQE